MIYTGLNNTGEVEAIYGHLNGVKSEVSEVYGSIDYNDPIFYSRKTLTGTSPLTFKALGQPLKDYHIFGETVQNGTPSPDYPVDLHGVGEKPENLFDKNTALVGYRIYGGSGVQNNSYSCSDFIDVRGFQSIAKNKSDLEITTFYFFNSKKQYLGKYDDHSPAAIPSDASYVRVNMLRDDLDSFVLSPGTIAPSSYIPYGYKIPITIGNVTTPIYIGSDPLYRVGEYVDEIRSNGTVVRKVIEQTLMGYGDPGGWSPWGDSRWAYVPPRDVPKIVNDDSAISNYYRKGTKNQQYFQWYNYIGQMIGFFKDTRFNTITEFRDYVKSLYDSGNPLKIYYILETPTAEQVTVPSLSTIVGDNTLTVDTTVKPSAVSITGHIKPTGYGQLLDINDVDIQDSTGEPIYIQG